MESGEERVRQTIAHLGSDAASAPDVPPGVTARIGAALRPAPHPPAHATTSGLPRLSRLRIIALILGIAAALAVVVAGIATQQHNRPPEPAFPAGPTAERMAVSAPGSSGDTPKAVVTRP